MKGMWMMNLFKRKKTTKIGSICVGVEVKQCKDCARTLTVDEAIMTIKAHCIQYPRCDGCHLLDEEEVCFFANNLLPDEWAFGGDSNG